MTEKAFNKEAWNENMLSWQTVKGIRDSFCQRGIEKVHVPVSDGGGEVQPARNGL